MAPKVSVLPPATSLVFATPDLVALTAGGGHTAESPLSRSLVSANSAIGLERSQGSSLSFQDRLGRPVHTRPKPHWSANCTASRGPRQPLTPRLPSPCLLLCLSAQGSGIHKACVTWPTQKHNHYGVTTFYSTHFH